MALRITEIFYSLQGESTTSGYPTVFVRLTGCPLRCVYCDTSYAFKGGQKLSLDEVVAQVQSHGVKHVCITGGEPLAQPACLPLMQRLCDEDFLVSIETSGALSIEGIDPRVMVVMDLKTPDSGEVERNLFGNLTLLKRDDQLKFVICSEQDFRWAQDLIIEHQLMERAEVLFSPSYGQVTPNQLADWLMESRLQARMQVQLHKLLWGEQEGR